MGILRAWMRNWYYVGGVIFAILALFLGLFGHMVDPARRIATVLFMCLLLHEFEEYAVPGGFPGAWNVGVSGERELGDRYPLNVKSAFIVNVCCAYPIYIAGIVFSNVHVLVVFIAYFTMLQIVVHGFVMNRKMGTLYNPGVATALFVMLPVGAYSVWFLATTYALPAWNLWASLLVFPLVAFLTILLPIRLNQDRQTPWAFPKRDTEGFSIEGKIARLRR